jgi:hypothetical protein
MWLQIEFHATVGLRSIHRLADELVQPVRLLVDDDEELITLRGL